MTATRAATSDRAFPPGLHPAAELVEATKRYGAMTALDRVSLSAMPGEVLAVLGPNGAGKTTAVSLMLGLARPTSGQARLFGADPRSAGSRMRIGTMLQVSGVPATLTVREHLTAFATYYPAPLSVDEAIAIAGLEGVANRLYGKLSGGQQQRLHFALAIVGDPDALFLDEPTTGLDAASRRAFWNHVREYLRGDRSVILTTHYLEEADALADKVVVLDRGKVAAYGTPTEVKARAAGRKVRAVTRLSAAEAAALAGVRSVERSGAVTTMLSTDSDATVRALLAADEQASGLEVTGAGLEEAFLSLTSGHGGNGADDAGVADDPRGRSGDRDSATGRTEP